MPAVMKQIPERCWKKWRKKKVEVRKVACGPARKQEQASANMLTAGIGFLRQASMNKFSDCKADD